VIEGRPGWTVVGEAATGVEAVVKAKKLSPDVVIVDIGMPELDGVQAIRQIKDMVPNAKLLVLTMHESDEMIQKAFEAGAHGYILKSDLTECLVKGIKEVLSGKRILTPKVSEIVLDGLIKEKRSRDQGQLKIASPTPRETEIIRLLASGKANKEIAALLRIAVSTVETHRARIMRKLSFHSLADLIHYALRSGIISW
jgi:DNA-binding NarL/FixJ family response regulator